MKVVILAGGMGSRLQEETAVTPKPLIPIGEEPLLWHLMKIYSSYGFNDFIICLGYKGEAIKKYFADYFLSHSDVTFDFSKGEKGMTVGHSRIDPWKVTLVDTGLQTQTGGRVKRIEPFVKGETFMLANGDTVTDLNFGEMLKFHQQHKKPATIAVVSPPGKFGVVQKDKDGRALKFVEKPTDGALIHAGFAILNPSIFKYLVGGDEMVWEKMALERMATEGQLMTYEHTGFWKCMDTLKNKKELEALWNSPKVPWKIWKD